VDVTQLVMDHPFAAARRGALSKHGAILRTISNPIGVERMARHARTDGPDDIAIVVLLQGTGYLEQGNHGGLRGAGDIAIHGMDQSFAIGSRDSYEEIRLQVPRAAFLSQVGKPQAFAGRKLDATPLSHLFIGYLRSVSGAVGGRTQAEAGIARDGVAAPAPHPH
jgi:AraC family transcriptional activator of tynA and feaB